MGRLSGHLPKQCNLSADATGLDSRPWSPYTRSKLTELNGLNCKAEMAFSGTYAAAIPKEKHPVSTQLQLLPPQYTPMNSNYCIKIVLHRYTQYLPHKSS